MTYRLTAGEGRSIIKQDALEEIRGEINGLLDLYGFYETNDPEEKLKIIKNALDFLNNKVYYRIIDESN